MNALARLQRWHERQNDIARADELIRIRTFSNPCWFVTIVLRHTALSGVHFPDFEDGIAETAPWSRCYVEENEWKGAGDDPERLIDVFLAWAEANGA